MHKGSESPPAALQAAPPRQNPRPTRVLSHGADVHKHIVFPEGPSAIQRVSVFPAAWKGPPECILKPERPGEAGLRFAGWAVRASAT